MRLVVAYLITYRVKQHGVDALQSLFGLATGVKEKVHKFLKCVLNEKALTTWIKDAWTAHFQHDYVDANLLQPLLHNLPQLRIAASQIEHDIYSYGMSKTKEELSVTIPKAFNLTQAAKRKLLLPEPMPTSEKQQQEEEEAAAAAAARAAKASMKLSKVSSTTMPSTITKPSNASSLRKKSTNANDYSSTMLAKTKHQQQQQHHREANAQQRPVKELAEKKIEVKPFKAQKLVMTANVDKPIKLNAAVLIKDEYLIRRQADEMIRKFESLESGEGNAAEFVKWQEAQRAEDARKRELEAETLKLHAKMCHEDAVLAKLQLVQANRDKAKRIKDEKARMFDEFGELVERNEAKQAALVKQVAEQERRAKLAKQKIEAEKRLVAQQLANESKQIEQLALKNVRDIT